MTLLDRAPSPSPRPEEEAEAPPPSEVDLQVKQSGKSVRVQTDKPHLVSLGGGRLSTGITIHPLHEGTTYVGRVDAGRPQDIIIQGAGAEREHCVIENTEGIVVLYPLCGTVTVDGVKADSPVRLTQGCMLCFGRSNHFRFNHPQQAKQIKKILPNGDISVVPAVQLRDIGELRELSDKPEEWRKKSRTLSRHPEGDREAWDSVDFVDKVSKFEFLSHRNPQDDRSPRDSGCSDVSWPASPGRTGPCTPERSPGCIILQQSHFSSAVAPSRPPSGRESEIEREKRKFLKELYGPTETPGTPEVSHLPEDIDIYCQERPRNAGSADDSERSSEDASEVKRSPDPVPTEGPYPSTCAQSPPHQKRIKTNGSLPRHGHHSGPDGPDQCVRIRPPGSRYQFSPVSSHVPTAGSKLINEDSPLLTHHVTQCEKSMSVQRKIRQLVEIRALCWKAISEYQRKMEELVVQENETLHELNMEHALIAGEELDEQGNQEKEIEELESLYHQKQIHQLSETLSGEEEWEKKSCLEDAPEEKSVSTLETEINTLKSSIRERKDRLKDLMEQQDILVKQLKEERQSLQKQKDQLTDYLQQEMGKLKRIEEELENLNLLNSFDTDDTKDTSLILEPANRFEREKGVERDAEFSVELPELDEMQKRTSDLWTGSDGVCEGSGAITSDSDITDCTENGKARRESLVIANPDDNCLEYEKCQNEDSADRKNKNAQRPLTRYLPVRGGDIDLRRHIESAGHQIVLCQHVDITSSTCKGYLHVLTGRWRSWKKRWVVFDRRQKTLVFYSDRSENKLKDGITFQCIEEVYVDHAHSSRSTNPRSPFCVKTDDQLYYLVAPNSESMRIWVDVIFTGAEGYRHFMPGFDP